jgi:Putative endonuclease segE, GIY-YIG domain
MYYYVYQITNLLNNKIYVGKHKSSIHPDANGYYGSGKQIKAAIEKYGIENFKKEVLHYCSSMDEMANKELSIVTEDFVKRKDTYNMHKGGNGGWDHYNGSDKHRETSRMGGQTSSSRASNPFKDLEFQKTFAWTRAPDRMKLLGQKANTPEANAKRKTTFEKIKHNQGEKNSQFGRFWISNVLTKEVKRITMSDDIPQGWVRGKKGHLPTKLWVNNGVKEHYILVEKEQEYKLNGFSSGRLKTSMPQNRIVV